MILIYFLLSVLIANICADDTSLLNDDNELDSIFADVLNGDYDFDASGEGRYIGNVQEEEPQLSDGVWKCGNCSDIDETKTLYSEILELDTNYEDTGFKLQIGYAVPNMRCIEIEKGAIAVRRVSGACSAGDVTLSIVQNSHIEVKIYE